jgi:hypothetical protein
MNIKTIKNKSTKKEDIQFQERLDKAIKNVKAIQKDSIHAEDQSRNKLDNYLNYYFSQEKDIKNNEFFIKALINADSDLYEKLVPLITPNISKESSFNIALYAISNVDHSLMKFVPPEIQTKEMVLTVIKHTLSGLIIEHFNDKLKADREVVKVAVECSGFALRYTPLFWNDRDIVETAVSKQGCSISAIVNQPLINDRLLFLKAVKNNGLALQYANNEFKNDQEIVFNAYQNNVYALNYLNEQFLEHPDPLIANDFLSFFYVSVSDEYNNHTSNIGIIKQNLLNHKNKELALHVENIFTQKEKLDAFFNKCSHLSEIYSERIDLMFHLKPFLDFMLPFWKKDSVQYFLESTEKCFHEKEKDFNQKERKSVSKPRYHYDYDEDFVNALKELSLFIKRKQNDIKIQEVLNAHKDNSKLKNKNRKIKLK